MKLFTLHNESLTYIVSKFVQ